jgi:hypothetical protein
VLCAGLAFADPEGEAPALPDGNTTALADGDAPPFEVELVGAVPVGEAAGLAAGAGVACATRLAPIELTGTDARGELVVPPPQLAATTATTEKTTGRRIYDASGFIVRDSSIRPQ